MCNRIVHSCLKLSDGVGNARILRTPCGPPSFVLKTNGAMILQWSYFWSKKNISGWWFGTFLFFPHIGNSNPNWLIFFRGVETTNQIFNPDVLWFELQKRSTSTTVMVKNATKTIRNHHKTNEDQKKTGLPDFIWMVYQCIYLDNYHWIIPTDTAIWISLVLKISGAKPTTFEFDLFTSWFQGERVESGAWVKSWGGNIYGEGLDNPWFTMDITDGSSIDFPFHWVAKHHYFCSLEW